MIELIFTFYNLIHQWRFKYEELAIEKQCEYHTDDDFTFKSETMKILNGIYVTFGLYISNSSDSYFMVECTKRPSEIEYIGIHAQFYCHQTDWQDIATG